MTTIKTLHFATIILSGWLVMCSMSHLIKISEKRLRRFLLFFGCSMLAAMIIFIGDPFNILATTPVFLAIVLLTCEGSIWQRITIGLMFSSTIFSFNALRDNYIHDLMFPPKRYGITSLIPVNSYINDFFSGIQAEHGYCISALFSLPFTLVLYLCIRKFAPDKDYTLSDSLWQLLFLLTITPLGTVLAVVTLFRSSNFYIDIFVHREYSILLLISCLPSSAWLLVRHGISKTAETGTAKYAWGNQPQVLRSDGAAAL